MEAVTAFKTVVLVSMVFAVVCYAMRGIASAVITLILGVGLAFSLANYLQTDRIVEEVAKSSLGASFGLSNFGQCKHPSLFSTRPDAECRQLVIDLATKQQGGVFAKQAIDAVTTLESKLNETSVLTAAFGK